MTCLILVLPGMVPEEDVEMPSWIANHFEFRPTVHLTIDDQHVDIIGRPMQELSRIFNISLSVKGSMLMSENLSMDTLL